MMTEHSSRRAIAPMLGVLAGLSGVELVVVHSLVALWWPAAAIVLSLVTLAGLAWLLLLIRSLRTRPSLIEADRMVLRCGRNRKVSVPCDRIAGLRTEGLTDAEVRADGVLNLAVIAFPNVIVDLVAPMRIGRRTVSAVAHRLDDLPAFVRATQAVCART